MQLFLRANEMVEDKNIRLQDLVKPNTFLSSTVSLALHSCNSLVLTEDLVGTADLIVKTWEGNEPLGRYRGQIGWVLCFLDFGRNPRLREPVSRHWRASGTQI